MHGAAPLAMGTTGRRRRRIDGLVERLRHGTATRRRAARALGSIGADAVAPLIELLESDADGHARAAACDALAAMEPGEALPAVGALRGALAVEHYAVRPAAAHALRAIDPAALREHALALDEKLRLELPGSVARRIDTLQSIGPPEALEALPWLRETLTGEHREPADQALYLLRTLGAEAREAAPWVAARIERDLGATYPAGSVVPDHAVVGTLTTALEVLATLEPAPTDVVPALRGALTHGEANVRQAAARAVAALGTGFDELAPDVERRLHDPSSLVRRPARDAARALRPSTPLPSRLRAGLARRDRVALHAEATGCGNEAWAHRLRSVAPTTTAPVTVLAQMGWLVFAIGCAFGGFVGMPVGGFGLGTLLGQAIFSGELAKLVGVLGGVAGAAAYVGMFASLGKVGGWYFGAIERLTDRLRPAPDARRLERVVRSLDFGPWPALAERLDAARADPPPLSALAAALRSGSWDERLVAFTALEAHGAAAAPVLVALARDEGARARTWAAHALLTEGPGSFGLLGPSPDGSARLCPTCSLYVRPVEVEAPRGHGRPGPEPLAIACPRCHRADGLEPAPDGITARLEAPREGAPAGRREGERWVVSPLALAHLPDADRLEIATGEGTAIESLAIRIGAEPDERRRERWRGLSCTVLPGVQLTPNDRRLLERAFGAVDGATAPGTRPAATGEDDERRRERAVEPPGGRR